MKIPYNTSQESFIHDYVTLMNCFFRLTDIEKDVVAEFIKIYVKYTPVFQGERLWSVTFNSDSRKEVQRNLNFKDRTNVDQYVKRLKEKKAILDKDGLQIHPLLIPLSNEITFEFRF